MSERSAEVVTLAEALCREYHPMHWDVMYGNHKMPCGACRVHGASLARLFDFKPTDRQGGAA